MKGLIQRVSEASVTIDGCEYSRINEGLLLLLGIEPSDTKATADALIDKVLRYRVFTDDNNKMNLSLQDTGGALMIVSQFTLAADTQQGRRPSFSTAAKPEQANHLYQHAITRATAMHHPHRVTSGQFAANMQVSLINDGPVTFLLSS